ncbi:MAG: nucleoside phosphorylase [Proteobacteria bacterium]|nr:nucleoside phosphorylase [Pseudomonadota bacterium]MBU4295471.1 nucleoside phosphorylase [Pseudomonadota bacterium]MCG2747658.1 nucleoside phosphorylase [Desulfobulbaceae bacterium]
MSDTVINPSRQKGEVHLTGPVLFFVNPGDAPPIINEARKRQAQKHFLFHSNLFEISGQPPIFWAGPALGAPAAVMALEKLIALGCKDVLVYGWCGSLAPGLTAGDIFLPTWSLSEEGTSAHYPLATGPAADEDLRRQLATFLQQEGYPVQEGPIWTTDAPFRETRQKVQEYGRQGIMAVDMEFSALSTVATYRSVNLAAAMLVSDELHHEAWRPIFASKVFKKKSLEIFLAMSRFACNVT